MSTWKKVELGDCCQVVSGATPQTNVADYWDGEICWVTPKDLSTGQNRYLDDTRRKLTEAGLESCGATVLPTGSVLLTSRAPIGNVAINVVPMATNQGFKSLVPKPGLVNAEYLYYWLNANKSYIQSLGRGATFKEISKDVVSSIEIPLPSYDEQRRIAEVLDRADELRAKRRQALAHLDDLTQSIFLDMFGDPRTNEHGWARAALHEMVAEFRYGTSTKSAEEGSPALRIPNVAAGALDLTEIKLVPVQPKEFERLRLRDDDLLFVRTNGNPDLVGRCAAFREELVSGSGYPVDEFIYASYLIRARPLPEAVDSLFLQVLMNTPYGRTMLRERCKTSAGQYNINIEGLGSVPVVTPPLELQRQFAERVRTVESAKNEQQAQLAELDALFASLQDRAFRGLL